MRALLTLLLVVPVLPIAQADPGLCTPADAGGVVTVTCEEQEYADGTQRATQIQITADHDAPIVPTFFVRVRFSEHADFTRCSIYYHRIHGDGPQSIEWGTSPCPYAFGLP